MAAITLKDLIAGQARLSEKEQMAGTKERMSMAEFKQITAAGGTNAMSDELKKHTGLLKIIADKKDTTRKGPDDTAKAEVNQEARTLEEGKVKLLSKIEENTRKDKKEEEKKVEEADITKLPLLIAGIAASLGALAGVVRAYVKTVKLFAEALTPQFIKNKITASITAIGNFFEGIATTVRSALKSRLDKFAKSTASLMAGLSMQLDLFKASMESVVKVVKTAFEGIVGEKIMSVVGYLKNAFTTLLKPFTTAFDLIKDLTSGPIGKSVSYITEVVTKLKQPFVSLGEGIAKFGKMFGFIATIVEKIAAPLMIVMAVWDTVKGAIEGYEKEGIVGAISGAIKGLIESLITGPVDMLKNATAWVLKQFGFEDASKYLESFSVTDMMKEFVDAIFHPVETIKSMFDGVVKFFEGIEIPKIGFTIPIINKEVSIGPFYPFKSDKPSAAKVEGGSPAPTASAKATEAAAVAAQPAKDKAIEAGILSPIVATEKVKASGIAQDMAITAAGTARQQYYASMGFTPEQVKTLEVRQSKIDAIKSQNSIEGASLNVAPVALPQVNAAAVYNQSAQNAGMTQVQQPVSNVVVAPTNVTNNRTQLPQARVEPRNVESTFGRLAERMFSPI